MEKPIVSLSDDERCDGERGGEKNKMKKKKTKKIKRLLIEKKEKNQFVNIL